MSRFRTLIDVETLAANLGAPHWVVLDCRFDLAKPAWGESEFAQSHIPGAQYAHLDRDLSCAPDPTSGRHPLPPAQLLAQRGSAWGVDDRVQVVVYDQGNGMYAARAWWLFRWLGHADVAMLDGGLAAWLAAGKPMTSQSVPPTARRFSARPNAALAAIAADVQRDLAAGSICLADARPADRFAGQNETIDPVAGHVPGAVNHPFARNLDAQGRFLPAAELRSRWLATLGGRAPGELVVMCGSGVSACHDLLALEHAGLGGARLYAGSWSEWIGDPARPVASGN